MLFLLGHCFGHQPCTARVQKRRDLLDFEQPGQ